ncbi:MAG: DUF5618 family protein [candidate division WOR-3 bacterium]
MKNGKIEIALKKLNLAKRYLENARELLKQAGIDRRRNAYSDLKYVSMASGTAYLSALEALKAIFILKLNVDEEFIKKKIKDISVYKQYIKELKIGKDKDYIQGLLTDIYDILHLGGYYRELQDKKAIDSGFEKVEKIIKIVESYVK